MKTFLGKIFFPNLVFNSDLAVYITSVYFNFCLGLARHLQIKLIDNIRIMSSLRVHAEARQPTATRPRIKTQKITETSANGPAMVAHT